MREGGEGLAGEVREQRGRSERWSGGLLAEARGRGAAAFGRPAGVKPKDEEQMLPCRRLSPPPPRLCRLTIIIKTSSSLKRSVGSAIVARA